MKSISFFLSLALLSTAVVFSSCKKDEEQQEDTTPTPTPQAVITINDPLPNAMFSLNDEVHIDVDITASFEMHGYMVELINETSGEVVWTTDAHDHGNSFHIHDHWVNNVTDHSDMKLRVTAELDHDGATTVKEVHFHCHPM
ncbi:MAG: hypothetical protein ACK500_06665 [Flavobacteriales bacterium]